MEPQTQMAQRTMAYLVGGWTNPPEKYARQIGSFPQIGVKIKNVWNHQLVMAYTWGEITNYLRSSYGMILQDFWD